MEITILSDQASWKNAAILALVERLRQKGHQVVSLHEAESVPTGDILFILGFFKIVAADILQRSQTRIVVHESALPKGRGWSPVSWLVIGGAKAIPLTLFEAVEKVDAGQIFLQSKVPLKGDELLPEIQKKVALAMMQLCEKFVDAYPGILKKGYAQKGKPSYYPRRKPADSEVDPKKSILKQFNLLRTVDNDVYPAFFKHQGSTFVLKIEKKN